MKFKVLIELGGVAIFFAVAIQLLGGVVIFLWCLLVISPDLVVEMA